MIKENVKHLIKSSIFKLFIIQINNINSSKLKTSMNLWAKSKDDNIKCYFIEIFSFQIIKNSISIKVIQDGDERKTEKKPK